MISLNRDPMISMHQDLIITMDHDHTITMDHHHNHTIEQHHNNTIEHDKKNTIDQEKIKKIALEDDRPSTRKSAASILRIMRQDQVGSKQRPFLSFRLVPLLVNFPGF